MSGAPLPALSPILYFPPELVVELALGGEHPHDMAERHGLDAVEYEHLVALPWFEELVARKRMELQDSGYLFQAKAAMMAEALLTRLFQQSMGGKLAAPMMIDVSKQLVEVGRLKPQPGVTPAAAGAGFQINIQINQDAVKTVALAADNVAPAKPAAAGAAGGSAPALTVDFRPVDNPSLPPKPAYIHAAPPPNFDRDATVRRSFGLGGSPAAQAAVNASPSTPHPGAAAGPGPAQTGVGLPKA